MFGAERQRVLDSCRWRPNEGQLGYFEAWTYENADDGEVEQWLHQQGRFSARVKPGQAKPTMRVRILMCERVGWLPVGFAMSRSSFLAMESALRLPPETLPLLVANNGKQCSNLRFRTDDGNRLESLALTAKLPQMFQLGNLGLAMSHHLEAGTTVAFLHGWNMFSDRDCVTNEPIVSHAESLHGMMQSATALWAHPLFLPTVLLREHLSRAEAFKNQLEPKATDIERRLGVTKSARLVGSETNTLVQQYMIQDDEERLRTTALLNTTATDVVNMLGILEWDLHYVKFLRRVNDDLGALHGRPPPAVDAELRSVVDYLECEALSVVSFVGTMKSRLDLQLNVLYNFIAQAGNNLNMKIAANAGLDSTAMKTLAVVTMIFLPPTFIATLFSMSMFDWQASSSAAEGAARTVVPEFWIYWAVSVPLTLAIVIGWRVWWHFQKTFYENKYLSVKLSEAPRPRRKTAGGA